MKGSEAGTGTIKLFNNEKSPELNVSVTAYCGGYEYSFSTQTVKEKVVADLGQLGGTQLTIFGNGYDVDGNSHSGIKVSSGQVLNIDKGTGETFVWKNFSSQGYGVLYSMGTINIIGSIEFSSNSAEWYGGAIYNWYGATMTISGTDIIFSSNSANNGGAIYNNRSTMTITADNITFSSNSAGTNGGAINNLSNSETEIFGDNVIFRVPTVQEVMAEQLLMVTVPQ